MSQQLLPKSIEMRALIHMENGVDAIEAVKLAFEEENNTLTLVGLGVDFKSGRYMPEVKERVAKIMCEQVYNRIRNDSTIQR